MRCAISETVDTLKLVIDMRGPPQIDFTMIGKVCEKDLHSLNIFPRMFLNAVITFHHSLQM